MPTKYTVTYGGCTDEQHAPWCKWTSTLKCRTPALVILVHPLAVLRPDAFIIFIFRLPFFSLPGLGTRCSLSGLFPRLCSSAYQFTQLLLSPTLSLMSVRFSLSLSRSLGGPFALEREYVANSHELLSSFSFSFTEAERSQCSVNVFRSYRPLYVISINTINHGFKLGQVTLFIVTGLTG